MAETIDRQAFWDLVGRYAESDDRSDVTLREELKNEISSALVTHPGTSIYLAKATAAGYRNQLWQGQALTQANDIVVFVDKTGNPNGLAEAARRRLDPETKNGFDAIVICEEKEGKWRVHSVVEYESQDVSDRLAKVMGAFKTVRLPDPAGWTGPKHPGASDVGTGNVYLDNLLEAKNLVLEGPPGTGKTHVALSLAKEMAKGDLNGCRLEEILRNRSLEDISIQEITNPPLIWEMIQFHPSYSYEDFMRGIRTDPKSPGFSLVPRDGILPLISHVARKRAGQPTLLILDEINRANLSQVFGEAIFALDPAQRGRPIRLQYGGDAGLSGELIVPSDLLVVGTLNTADKSISALDFAIRRRFRFLRLSPSVAALEGYYSEGSEKAKKTSQLMIKINQHVRDKSLAVGHSYFMHDPEGSQGDWADELSERLVLEVVPLLIEYSQEGIISEKKYLELGGISIVLSRDQDSYNKSKFCDFLLGRDVGDE